MNYGCFAKEIETNNTMDLVVCKEVIISTIRRRGDGTEENPIRVITEVFEKDGTFIAECDPQNYVLK